MYHKLCIALVHSLSACWFEHRCGVHIVGASLTQMNHLCHEIIKYENLLLV